VIVFTVLMMTAGAGNSQSTPYIIPVATERAITSGELVRVKKLRKDMANVRESISTEGPSVFQDPATVDKYVKRFGQFTDAIKRYNDFEHADVLQAREEYIALRTVLSEEHARAKKQAEGLGDVQSELAGIEAELHSKRPPQALIAPFSAKTAKLWVAAAVDAKQTAQSSMQRLPEIVKTARLEKSNAGTVQQGAAYDQQDIDRLSRLAQGNIAKVDQARDSTLANLKAQLDGVNNELEYFRQLDPNNSTHRMNAFLKEGAAEEIHSRLDEQYKIANSAANYMAAFGQAPTDNLKNRLDEITQLKAQYDVQLEQAAGAYTLPNAASDDPSLLAVAKKIIEKPAYAFGKHGPIVLTSKGVVDKEREESETKFTEVDVSLSGDITLTGTETTWTYRWQEFKFATPVEEADGSWYVWWITARKFSSGGSRTPIGEWVSGKSVKGSLIRRENF